MQLLTLVARNTFLRIKKCHKIGAVTIFEKRCDNTIVQADETVIVGCIIIMVIKFHSKVGE